LLFDTLRDCFQQLKRAWMKFAGFLMDEQRHRHAPLALPRQRIRSPPPSQPKQRLPRPSGRVDSRARQTCGLPPTAPRRATGWPHLAVPIKR
jgi:hypothetical protein